MGFPLKVRASLSPDSGLTPNTHYVYVFTLFIPANFHFALVGHLLKGFRHPTPTTVSRTSRILTMLLGIVAKPTKKDKFEVTKESVAYLAALVSVSEEVRSRCHVRHHMSRHLASSNENMNWSPKSPTNRRQKSWDLLDQTALVQARSGQQGKQTTVQQVSVYCAIFTFA